jgi:hypothetical protein
VLGSVLTSQAMAFTSVSSNLIAPATRAKSLDRARRAPLFLQCFFYLHCKTP